VQNIVVEILIDKDERHHEICSHLAASRFSIRSRIRAMPCLPNDN
jgi:hypothetical protein